MPTLDFKGKQFIYSHHHNVPFRELKIDKEKSLPKDGKASLDDNLIIHGDNLHALKALMPLYAGKVKCIYIDPPYNTGNEGWCYNDNVNSPLMKEWFEKNANPVDKEDLQRHDKWLCMMYPRLKLLHELLADDGVIFVSIDDNEQHHLRTIMDEIFGEENFVGNISWESKTKSQNTKESYNKLQPKTEHILLYTKKNHRRFNLIQKGEKKYLQKDSKGNYREYLLEVMNSEGARGRESMIFEVNGILPPQGKQWQLGQQTIYEYKSRDDLFVRDNKIFLKMRPEDEKTELTEPFWGLFSKDIGTAESAKKELSLAFNNEKHGFETVKPVGLIKRLLFHSTSLNDTILDSFAGSGTTAHAVLDLNLEDGGNRKFICVEMENYANDVTAERVRRVIKGVPNAKDAKLKNGLGGSFTFCELGDEFNIEKILTGENLPKYESLANYVFYTATGKSLEKAAKPRSDYFIGETDLYEIYLVYKADIAYLRSNESALNSKIVEIIAGKESKKQKLVYATAKYMGQNELNEHKITFCQLPYAIHKIMGK